MGKNGSVGERWQRVDVLRTSGGLGRTSRAAALATRVGSPSVKTVGVICAGLLLALSGCSGGAPEDAPTTPAAVTESPADQADMYALEKSGGERNGCSAATPGQEAESDPGCRYAAAFAGCLEGITGEQVGPMSAEEEWANEPALVELQLQAIADCTA